MVLLLGGAWLAAQEEVTAGPANLIANHSFELGDYDPDTLPEGWEKESFLPNATFTWRDDAAQHGRKSLQISAESPNDALIVQTVKVKKNTTYLYSGWIKTENVQSTAAGANLCINGTFERTTGLTGTNDWAFVSMLVQTGNETVLSLCARLGYWSDATSGTAWFDNLKFVELAPDGPKPTWKVLVLVYGLTDFTYVDGSGTTHRVLASMSIPEREQAAKVAQDFVNIDIPALSSGNLVPEVTVRYPEQTLTNLTPYGADAFWLGPNDIGDDLDPAFDAVIVIWNPEGEDINSGNDDDLSGGKYDRFSPDRGTNQAYSLITARAVLNGEDRNDFKWAFGRSILNFFDSAGTTPLPKVNNNPLPTEFVNCVSGKTYVWEEETLENPIPNSIYNNDSGFTHDYYSGMTALATRPDRCLGITAQAWATGGPVSGPIFFTFGAEVDPQEQSADPGVQVIYQLSLENQGNMADTYQVAYSSNQWPIDGPAQIGPLDVDQAQEVPVKVTIPQGADGLAADTLTVELLSTQNDDISGTLEVTTTANAIYDFSAVPDAGQKSGDAGEVISYTVTIENMGNITDTYDIGYSGNDWTVGGPAQVGPVARGQSADFVVQVTIPDDAMGLDTDDLLLTITSQGDDTAEKSLNLTTIAGAVYAFSAAADPDQKNGDVGTDVNYTVEIENNGNITDTYDIQVAGHQWPVDGPQTAGPLGPGQSTAVDVTVAIPQDALGTASDTVVVTLTSQGDDSQSAEVTLTTKSNPFYAVQIAPMELTAFGIIGTNKEYSLTVKNTGNVRDSFNLNSSNGSWPVDLPGEIGPLSAGQSAQFIVTVAIPEDAGDGEEQTAVITATSRTESSAAAGAALTTLARWPVIYMPVMRR